MTRRKFINKLLKVGSAVVVGASWLAKKGHSAEQFDCPELTAEGLSRSPTPRKPAVRLAGKFIRAVRLKKYPGSLRPLRDISKRSKWSG